MKTSKTIHIVAFDMPHPPNYGGVIDIYFKIVALHSLGVKVILHVFLYDGKEPSADLSKHCQKVYYYKRRRFSNPFTGEQPYIVTTRNDEALLKNLLKDAHPILFEGLHTTYFLGHSALKKRFKIVRMHNIEHAYYKALEDAETGFFKKYFFRVESERLLVWEKVLQHAQSIMAISPEETAYYENKFGKTVYLPAFHSNNEVLSQSGHGRFLLYHGNLGVGENNKAALYLVHEVFSKLEIPCVIAGNNPSRQLELAVKGKPYISIVGKISSADILSLVQQAHINVLVTFQSTGIKLKLLNALFMGRFCVSNGLMVEKTGLEQMVAKANNPEKIIATIEKLWLKDFTIADVETRKQQMGSAFDNISNAKKIIDVLPV